MGQICKPIFDVDSASLEFELNNTTLGQQHYWRTFFPLKKVARFSVKTIEGDEGLPVAARRVAFNSRNPKFTRETIGKREIALGKYAASRDKNEIEIQEYRDLQAIAATTDDPAVAEEMVNIAYDDVRFCERSIPAKIEIDALGIGSRGKQVYSSEVDGDMVTEEDLDFGVPEDNFGGVAVDWADTKNADGIADLANWQTKIGKAGYGKPRYAILEDKAFKQLCAQEKVAKKLFPMAKLLDIMNNDAIDLTAINRYMDGHGFPHLLVIDSYAAIEHKDGKKEIIKPWNENVVTLSETPQLGWTYWKPKHIEDAEDKVSVDVQGEFYNISIVGERNPDLVTTSAEAYAQVGLINKRKLAFINITGGEWNEGATNNHA